MNGEQSRFPVRFRGYPAAALAGAAGAVGWLVFSVLVNASPAELADSVLVVLMFWGLPVAVVGVILGGGSYSLVRHDKLAHWVVGILSVICIPFFLLLIFAYALFVFNM